jgi:hypothetical protein
MAAETTTDCIVLDHKCNAEIYRELDIVIVTKM